ncbi:MAG: 2,3-bisphosphoglycerate-dependent phosphoglycerate mutase [bacterium]
MQEEKDHSKRGKLIIVRHTESEWNKLGLWQGSRDIHLTEDGFKKSEEMGSLIKGIHIDRSFASTQIRSYETLLGMEEKANDLDVPVEFSSALNERDYGDYTGKNKWEVKEQVGEEKFDHIRRDWDYPVPNGETLKMVYERVVPYYKKNILPLVLEGKNVLVVSHGNAIRALMKYIENIPDEDIKDVEMIFGSILLYDVDDEGRMIKKDIKKIITKVNA